MAAIDEKIESEIRSLLDFSVVDVVPVAPVGLNLKLILSVNNQGLVEMIEEKKKGREPYGYLYDLCLRQAKKHVTLICSKFGIVSNKKLP